MCQRRLDHDGGGKTRHIWGTSDVRKDKVMKGEAGVRRGGRGRETKIILKFNVTAVS